MTTRTRSRLPILPVLILTAALLAPTPSRVWAESASDVAVKNPKVQEARKALEQKGYVYMPEYLKSRELAEGRSMVFLVFRDPAGKYCSMPLIVTKTQDEVYVGYKQDGAPMLIYKQK